MIQDVGSKYDGYLISPKISLHRDYELPEQVFFIDLTN